MTPGEKVRVNEIRKDVKLSIVHFTEYQDEEEIKIRAQWMKLNDAERVFLLSVIDSLTAELAAEKKRADAAVSDLEELMYSAGTECDFCTKGLDGDCGYHDGLRESCCPKWRGPVAAEGELK